MVKMLNGLLKIIVLFLLTSGFVGLSQESFNSTNSNYGEKFGSLNLKINFFPSECLNIRKTPLFSLKVIGAVYSGEIPFTGRKNKAIINGEHGCVDEYELDVPEGVYRVVVKEKPNVRLANFFVKAKNTIELQIDNVYLASDEICSENIGMIANISFNGEHLFDRAKRLHDSRIFKISREIIILGKPFEAIVNYCEKETTGSITKFKYVKLFYKDYYIIAERLIINNRKKKIVALGSKKSTVFFRKGQGVFGNELKFTIDFN